MTKQFLLAALGFNVNSQVSEAEFNAKYAGQDWIDTEEASCGEVYHEIAGRKLRANVNVKDNPVREGELQNTFRWLPY
jgi:hypothetical protein